jgi:two-component system, chemotaxis family, chemotaxis protein CheY
MAPNSRCPVLIVEDDGDLREMMAQLLTIEGFQATTVANGREALEYLNTGARPDVILLDLMMPVMDGWEFARRLHERTPPLNIPILVLSAARLPTERLTVLGARAVLAKPFDVDELLDQVARLVDGAVGGGSTGTPGAWAPGF